MRPTKDTTPLYVVKASNHITYLVAYEPESGNYLIVWADASTGSDVMKRFNHYMEPEDALKWLIGNIQLGALMQDLEPTKILEVRPATESDKIW